MEDATCVLEDADGLGGVIGAAEAEVAPRALYGLFDGHGGACAARFAADTLAGRVLASAGFPSEPAAALREGYARTDDALRGEPTTSGTTALVVLVWGRCLAVANAGDCRAVLCRRGRAIALSSDQKPEDPAELSRIRAAGGFVEDGFLNGQLGVARALGDWGQGDDALKRADGGASPLTAEPDVEEHELTEEDEFLILGCDGLWDVFSSQNAVEFARGQLRQHNDPERCSRELVSEALRRNTTDNVSVITVCFSEFPPPKRDFSRAGSKSRLFRSVSAEGLATLKQSLQSPT